MNEITVNDIGVIGMAVMGRGVAKNLSQKGYKVAIYNRNPERTKEVRGANIFPYMNVKEFVDSLSRPRKVIVLVKAGQPTDDVIAELIKYLDSGDVVMDMGNSFYMDTERRFAQLKDKGIDFLGVGISGGERGAEEGPSIMAGGGKDAWNKVSSILNRIAASGADGPCCDYFGTGGAGHFVKMVHNGIEYGYMGVISELHNFLRQYYSLDHEDIKGIFLRLSKDKDVSSYLMEITAKILEKKDDLSHGYIIDKIEDNAGNKGTGRWTSEAAMAVGMPVPTLTSALYTRYLSSADEIRRRNSGDETCNEKMRAVFDEDEQNIVKGALEFSQYICFDQGLVLIKKKSEEMNWNIAMDRVLKVWESGCIIRTAFSGRMRAAYEIAGESFALSGNEPIKGIVDVNLACAQKVVSYASLASIYLPCISSAVNYYVGIHAHRLPTSMIQAQRDFFGAHTYNRTDLDGIFHTQWE